MQSLLRTIHAHALAAVHGGGAPQGENEVADVMAAYEKKAMHGLGMSLEDVRRAVLRRGFVGFAAHVDAQHILRKRLR